MKVLQKYKVIKKLIIHSRNRIFLNGNIFQIEDIRFSNNSIKLSGSQQCLLCNEQSFFVSLISG